MKKEIYYWIVLIVIILAAALYVRLNYNPPISISLNFSSSGSNTTIYQYQQDTLNLQVLNNGPTVKGLPVGLSLNGNLTDIYNISLPTGKGTIIKITHTFGNPGSYNFTAETDPTKLYGNINQASTSITVTVLPPANATPQKMLPVNQTGFYASNMTILGYGISSYLNKNYSVSQTRLSNISPLNLFMDRLFTIGGSYIENISVAGAEYNNGNGLSLWFDGYLKPSIIGVAAQAENLTVSNQTIGTQPISLIRLSPNVTTCSWYSSGWIKTFSWEGNETCAEILSKNPAGISENNTLKKLLPFQNNTVSLADFYANSNTWSRYGNLIVTGKDALAYYVLWNNFTENHTCYGLTDTFNSSSFCSVYMLQNTGSLGNVSLIRTTEYLGKYNISIFSITNASTNPFEQVSSNIGMIQKLKLPGDPINFTSGISNTCDFSEVVSCGTPTFANSSISLNLTNIANQTIKINSIGCFMAGIGPGSSINKTLAVGASTLITTECYNNSKTINAIPLNLQLRLLLNYTENNTSKTIQGGALITI